MNEKEKTKRAQTLCILQTIEDELSWELSDCIEFNQAHLLWEANAKYQGIREAVRLVKGMKS